MRLDFIIIILLFSYLHLLRGQGTMRDAIYININAKFIDNFRFSSYIVL